MKTVLVVAPHADDETLGVGGTLLKLRAEGCELHWLLVTEMTVKGGFSSSEVDERNHEIRAVSEGYGFSQVHRLGFLPSQLDVVPKSRLVSAINSVVAKIRPETVYTVFRDDAHSDHEVVFDAVVSATKIFRHPYIKRILAYETLSETDFALKPGLTAFRPNVFVNIEDHLEEKINLMKIFRSEIGDFPFPHSPRAIEALASIRGVQAGCLSAEAFMLLKEVG